MTGQYFEAISQTVMAFLLILPDVKMDNIKPL